LRYPEEELISVRSKQVYSEPVRPINYNRAENKLSSQHEYDDVLNIEDVTGKKDHQTRLRNNITIREENSIAALRS
jgi:hypothetical protein